MKFIVTILVCFCFSPAQAVIVEVGGGKQFSSITAALAACMDYDTIIVDKGLYYEKNIIISKPVYLMGVGLPVLDGEQQFEIISIKADNVTVDGFLLQHTGISSVTDYAAVKIYNRRNVAVINNIINDAFFGIYVQYGINCLIQNNTLSATSITEQQSANGIHCWKSDSMLIIANKVSGHRDGIYFEFVTNSVIWRNCAFGNMRYGLHFMFSNDDAYISNIFEDNGAGVAVMFSHGVKMFNNYFRKNWGDASYGILLKEISDSYITGNHFEENTTAIYAEGASRILMKNNLFVRNGWALKIQASCLDLHLEYNDFISNTFDVATNGTLVLSNFNHNYWDKYEGYDLNKDGTGDICYRPVSLYSMIIEQNPATVMLFRSFMTSLLDRTEKILPTLTPEALKDDLPLMKPCLI